MHVLSWLDFELKVFNYSRIARESRFMPFSDNISVKGMQAVPVGVWTWFADSIQRSSIHWMNINKINVIVVVA